MAKKKTETIAKKKSSPKYPWEDCINEDNKRKESSLCVTFKDIYLYCSIHIIEGEKNYTLGCIDYYDCIFWGTFKTLSSAKKFAEKEFEKRFNMKKASFNRF